MFIGSVSKQPGERKDRDVSFADYLADRPGDTITSATIAVDDPALVVERVLPIVSPVVKVWFDGGEDGKAYKVTLTATTAMGRVVEVEIRMRVREV